MSETESDDFAGIFALTADTERGAGGPLAAPLDCADADDYRRAIRWRWKHSPAVRQQLAVIARRQRHPSAEPIPVIGPFAAEARAVLASLSGIDTTAN